MCDKGSLSWLIIETTVFYQCIYLTGIQSKAGNLLLYPTAPLKVVRDTCSLGTGTGGGMD